MSQSALDHPGRGESLGQWTAAIAVGAVMSSASVLGFQMFLGLLRTVPTFSGWGALSMAVPLVADIALMMFVVVTTGWAFVYASRLRAREADKKG